MDLSVDIETKKKIFSQNLEQIKIDCEKAMSKNEEDDDMSSVFSIIGCRKILKTIYIDKIQTNYIIYYENNHFILEINCMIPELEYNSQKTTQITIFQKEFEQKNPLIDRYFSMDVDDVQKRIENKLQEYFIYHNDQCSVFACGNPASQNCPRCGYFICSMCLLNISMNQDNICCPQCRFRFLN
jgi:hypothetical protein